MGRAASRFVVAWRLLPLPTMTPLLNTWHVSSRLRRGTLVIMLGAAMLLIGCGPTAPRRRVVYRAPGQRIAAPAPTVPATVRTGGGPSDAEATRTSAAYDTQPMARITAVTTRIPASWETPPLVGRMQHHRVVAGENLLEIARASGLGFREVRDANPTIDEWEPRAGVDIVLPSRWVLPRTTSRGLVVNIPDMRLYYFPSDAVAGEQVPLLTWPIGIGAEEAPSPVGPFTVKSKDENPTWVVPASIQRTMDHPRAVVPPGPDNPLGDYRIRLSIDVYAIHGTNDPWTVGRLTTHGCIRLYPEDIEALYPLVAPGTPGEIVYQPVKFGQSGDRVYVEVHQDVYQMYPDLEGHALGVLADSGLGSRVDVERVRAAVRAKTGVPTDVTRITSGPRVNIVHSTPPGGDA